MGRSVTAGRKTESSSFRCVKPTMPYRLFLAVSAWCINESFGSRGDLKECDLDLTILRY